MGLVRNKSGKPVPHTRKLSPRQQAFFGAQNLLFKVEAWRQVKGLPPGHPRVIRVNLAVAHPGDSELFLRFATVEPRQILGMSRHPPTRNLKKNREGFMVRLCGQQVSKDPSI